MRIRGSRRAPFAVRAVKAGTTSVLAVTALAATLSHAFALSAMPANEAATGSARVAEAAAVDARCEGLSGKTLIQTPRGEVKSVSFERGWEVLQGERPGTLLVVCPD